MNVSICGLGVMGNNHLRACKNNGFNVISKFDPQNKDDYSLFLKSLKQSHALIIASPTSYHTKNLFDALEANPNLKILCEKPISFSSNDEFIKYLMPFEKNILVGQIERFNPVVKKIKSILDSIKENIVQIKTIRVNNSPAREKIDVRKDIGIHDLDVATHLLGSYPKQIFIMNSGLNEQKTHENLIYKINDTQVINEISWKYPFKDRRIQILVESGFYEAHYYNQTLKFIDWTNNEESVQVTKLEPLNEELKFLEKMVKEDVSSCVTISENIKLLNLLGF